MPVVQTVIFLNQTDSFSRGRDMQFGLGTINQAFEQATHRDVDRVAAHRVRATAVRAPPPTERAGAPSPRHPSSSLPNRGRLRSTPL